MPGRIKGYMHSISESLNYAATLLGEAGISEARREASSLMAAALRKEWSFLIAHPEYTLSKEESAEFHRMIARRASREPFHYITGTKEFYGLEFEVSPAVLIPRPETEMLVSAAIIELGKARPGTFCEVGTGSGCISVAVLANVPKARAVGLEISPEALRLSTRNAERHGVSARLELRHSDLFKSLVIGEAFDVIVSNPPYIPAGQVPMLQPEVREHEPRGALTDGSDGLSIVRRLVAQAPVWLNPGGLLLFEIGAGQVDDVLAMFDRTTWTQVSAEADLQGIQRVVYARHAEG